MSNSNYFTNIESENILKTPVIVSLDFNKNINMNLNSPNSKKFERLFSKEKEEKKHKNYINVLNSNTSTTKAYNSYNSRDVIEIKTISTRNNNKNYLKNFSNFDYKNDKNETPIFKYIDNIRKDDMKLRKLIAKKKIDRIENINNCHKEILQNRYKIMENGTLLTGLVDNNYVKDAKERVHFDEKNSNGEILCEKNENKSPPLKIQIKNELNFDNIEKENDYEYGITKINNFHLNDLFMKLSSRNIDNLMKKSITFKNPTLDIEAKNFEEDLILNKNNSSKKGLNKKRNKLSIMNNANKIRKKNTLNNSFSNFSSNVYYPNKIKIYSDKIFKENEIKDQSQNISQNLSQNQNHNQSQNQSQINLEEIEKEENSDLNLIKFNKYNKYNFHIFNNIILSQNELFEDIEEVLTIGKNKKEINNENDKNDKNQIEKEEDLENQKENSLMKNKIFNNKTLNISLMRNINKIELKIKDKIFLKNLLHNSDDEKVIKQNRQSENIKLLSKNFKQLKHTLYEIENEIGFSEDFKEGLEKNCSYRGLLTKLYNLLKPKYDKAENFLNNIKSIFITKISMNIKKEHVAQIDEFYRTKIDYMNEMIKSLKIGKDLLNKFIIKYYDYSRFVYYACEYEKQYFKKIRDENNNLSIENIKLNSQLNKLKDRLKELSEYRNFMISVRERSVEAPEFFTQKKNSQEELMILSVNKIGENEVKIYENYKEILQIKEFFKKNEEKLNLNNQLKRYMISKKEIFNEITNPNKDILKDEKFKGFSELVNNYRINYNIDNEIKREININKNVQSKIDSSVEINKKINKLKSKITINSNKNDSSNKSFNDSISNSLNKNNNKDNKLKTIVKQGSGYISRALGSIKDKDNEIEKDLEKDKDKDMDKDKINILKYNQDLNLLSYSDGKNHIDKVESRLKYLIKNIDSLCKDRNEYERYFNYLTKPIFENYYEFYGELIKLQKDNIIGIDKLQEMNSIFYKLNTSLIEFNSEENKANSIFQIDIEKSIKSLNRAKENNKSLKDRINRLLNIGKKNIFDFSGNDNKNDFNKSNKENLNKKKGILKNINTSSTLNVKVNSKAKTSNNFYPKIISTNNETRNINNFLYIDNNISEEENNEVYKINNIRNKSKFFSIIQNIFDLICETNPFKNQDILRNSCLEEQIILMLQHIECKLNDLLMKDMIYKANYITAKKHEKISLELEKENRAKKARENKEKVMVDHKKMIERVNYKFFRLNLVPKRKCPTRFKPNDRNKKNEYLLMEKLKNKKKDINDSDYFDIDD
jgi:hypothetical protein